MQHSPDAVTAGQLAAQARRLAELESQLEQYAAKGEQRIDIASRSLKQAEQAVGSALDVISRKLSEGAARDPTAVNDAGGLQREIDRLKIEEVGQHFGSVAAAVHTLRRWAGSLAEDLAPQVESARALLALARRVRPVVLVVEDNEFQQSLLKGLLAEADLELAFAASGIEALATLHRQRPDLILMDVNLPDIDGIETTRRLKSVKQFADIPVVMITGHSEKNVVVESRKAGASDFVVKPFTKGTLLAKVRDFLPGTSPS
jgi:CheY-like chemotaxis protein